MIARQRRAGHADLGLSHLGLAHDQELARRGARERRVSVSARLAGRLPRGERLLQRRDHDLGVDVAHHRERRVIGREELVLEGDDVLARDLGDRLLPSHRGMRERALAHEEREHRPIRHRLGIVLRRRDPAQGLVLLALELLVREGGRDDDIAEQLETGVEVLLQHLAGDHDLLGRGPRAERAADEGDLLGDLAGVALAGALGQQVGGEAGHSFLAGRIAHRAGGGDQTEVDERQPLGRHDVRR